MVEHRLETPGVVGSTPTSHTNPKRTAVQVARQQAFAVGVAQLAEYPALTRNVVGSIPTAHTIRQKLAFASSRA